MTIRKLTNLLNKRFINQAAFRLEMCGYTGKDLELPYLTVSYCDECTIDSYKIILQENSTKEILQIQTMYNDSYLNSYIFYDLRPIDILNYIQTILKLEKL